VAISIRRLFATWWANPAAPVAVTVRTVLSDELIMPGHTTRPGRSMPVVKLLPRAGPVAVLLIAIAGAAPGAWAQNDIPGVFEFSFSNPGARSMGFGGAFAALADDGTAAFANPAGLVQLVEPEVSVEVRGRSYSTPFTAGGRIFGEPLGIGLDSAPGLREGRSSADLAGVSFLSYSRPVGRGALAFYRHELADFEFSGAMHGLFSGPWPDDILVRREFDQLRATDMEMVSYGLTGAYRVHENLSIGLGMAYYAGTLSSLTGLYLRADGFGSVEEAFSAIPFAPENLNYTLALETDDDDWALLGGFLWRLADGWRIGGFFREGPELETASRFTTGAAFIFDLPAGFSQVVKSGPLAFPDVFGLGLSYRSAGESLTLAVEWDRVSYSSMVHYFSSEPGNEMEDADEIHLGAEWVFVRSRPVVALRAGAWLDPAHRLHNDTHYVLRSVLPPGEDELHVAAGLGIALRDFQLDLAVDLSDAVDAGSMSIVYSF